MYKGARRSAAIGGDMDQDFLQLFNGDAAGESGIGVNAQLLEAAQPGEDAERQDAS